MQIEFPYKTESERERRLRSILEHAGDALFVHDIDGGSIVDVNQRACETLGYTREELLQLTAKDIEIGVDPRKITEICHSLSPGMPITVEGRHQRKDGSTFPVEVRLGLLDAGDPPLLIALARDITTRRRTEEALRESQRSLATLMSNLPGMAYRCRNDRNWTMELVSDGSLSLTGYVPTELQWNRLLSYADLIHPDDREAVWNDVQEAVRAHVPFQLEYRITTRSGLEKWVWEKGQGVFSAGGELLALEGFITEITERRRAEERLKLSEERFRQLSQEFKALLDAIPDNLTLQSSDLKVVWANRGAGAGLGKEASELLGKHCYDLWHGRTDSCEVCPVKRCFASGQAEQDTVTTPDGRVWDLRAVPIKDENGSVINVIEVGRDLTEQRRLEEQLRQSQKMQAIGQLAGGIAHDFNNILTAIIGYCNFMQMLIREDERSRVYLDQVISAAEKGANLTQSLLAFSRKQVINPRPVELNETVKNLQKLLLRLIGEEVELKTVLTNVPLVVMADGGQLEQVLMNLATNARDSMAAGGVITIETARVELDMEAARRCGMEQEGVYALMKVSDTGVGMDEETRKRIFEPFFTTKEFGKGTGLGLSMAYGIVKQHRGCIDVVSEPGKGTTFKVLLPIHEEGLYEEGPPVVPLQKGGVETILIAEDDETVRRLSRDILERFGYRVITAEDGKQAVEEFSRHKDEVDLLLLDVMMPRKNGKEAYTEIQRMRPGIKVLFMSGYTADLVQKQGILEEGLNFMQKPVTMEMLLSRVRKVLDS